MYTIVLLRHGESTWNKENRFTGWTDVDLSEKGTEEAKRAARLIAEAGFSFDLCYTSMLRRAIRTLWIVLDKMDLMYLPVEHSWRLNERHYGALQGLDKRETYREVRAKTRSCSGAGDMPCAPQRFLLTDKRHPRFRSAVCRHGPGGAARNRVARRHARPGGASTGRAPLAPSLKSGKKIPCRSPREQHPCSGQVSRSRSR